MTKSKSISSKKKNELTLNDTEQNTMLGHLVDGTTAYEVAKELKKISKETNVRYKEKRDYNIRNNIKPWQK